MKALSVLAALLVAASPALADDGATGTDPETTTSAPASPAPSPTPPPDASAAPSGTPTGTPRPPPSETPRPPPSETPSPPPSETPRPPPSAGPAAPPASDAGAPDDDARGTPGENEPPPRPSPPRARLMSTTLHHHVRAHLEDHGRLEKTEDVVAGGRHWRIKTAEGAVHVWVPPGYDRATAGTVIYVHGYYTNADGAWRDYHLARQFRKSRQNAMFIVPDAPAGNDDPVNWPALKDLRRAVVRANIHLPDGPVIVMGHSGAFRTVMQWVDHRLVEQIILLDAMYAGERQFDDFIGTGKRADRHKLIVVGASTAQESASFAKKYRFAAVRERVPERASEFTHHQRQARLLYIRSQYDHMSIVTSGRVIPVLLHLTPLKAL